MKEETPQDFCFFFFVHTLVYIVLIHIDYVHFTLFLVAINCVLRVECVQSCGRFPQISGGK